MLRKNDLKAATYSGIAGGFVLLLLNFYLNPGFMSAAGLMGKMQALIPGIRDYFDNVNIGLITLLFIMFFIMSELYSFFLMLFIRNKSRTASFGLSLLAGAGLYIVRTFVHSGFHPSMHSFIYSWLIFIIYLIYSIIVNWQFRWFQFRLENRKFRN